MKLIRITESAKRSLADYVKRKGFKSYSQALTNINTQDFRIALRKECFVKNDLAIPDQEIVDIYKLYILYKAFDVLKRHLSFSFDLISFFPTRFYLYVLWGMRNNDSEATKNVVEIKEVVELGEKSGLLDFKKDILSKAHAYAAKSRTIFGDNPTDYYISFALYLLKVAPPIDIDYEVVAERIGQININGDLEKMFGEERLRYAHIDFDRIYRALMYKRLGINPLRIVKKFNIYESAFVFYLLHFSLLDFLKRDTLEFSLIRNENLQKSSFPRSNYMRSGICLSVEELITFLEVENRYKKRFYLDFYNELQQMKENGIKTVFLNNDIAKVSDFVRYVFESFLTYNKDLPFVSITYSVLYRTNILLKILAKYLLSPKEKMFKIVEISNDGCVISANIPAFLFERYDKDRTLFEYVLSMGKEIGIKTDKKRFRFLMTFGANIQYLEIKDENFTAMLEKPKIENRCKIDFQSIFENLESLANSEIENPKTKCKFPNII